MIVFKDEFEILGVSKEKQSTETGKRYFTILAKLKSYTPDFGMRVVEERISHEADLSKFIGKKVQGHLYQVTFEGRTTVKILEVLNEPTK